MKLINKSMLTVVITLSTASVYYAQQVQDTVDTRSKDIEAVVLTGVADIAKDRKTPVAVSTIKEAQIVERLGNQEFPEILNTTPSVYATKSGGGFGDSKIGIRGFDQINIAVMVNGMPVNDMENGAVYWSNWAGLSDVTSALQVQRGLGASKLAIASVGGTINVLTRAADKKQGGIVTFGLGNDGYYKGSFAYNTGKSAKGWSSSFLMSRTAGNTYADGTNFEGYNYYFALGFQPNKKHDFQFTITGAPQWHNQRSYQIKISDLLKYSSNDKPNRRYNADWGYLNGEEFSNRANYYHKPVMSLNWDWKMSDNSKLSTVGYASFGRGAGTGDLGSVGGKRLSNFARTSAGLLDFDAIYAANQASNPDAGQLIRRASVNSHNWFGLISNFNHKINENLNFSVGIDTRYYKGYHYQVVSDLIGASAYKDTANKNIPANYVSAVYAPKPTWNPFGGKTEPMNERIGYSNDGEVLWYGGFGQVEYSNDNLSVFVQGAVSNQAFQRIDSFIKDGTVLTNGTLYTKTGFKDIIGYNVKAGANYNINEQHNVFANLGYYSKQPFFNAVYPNNQNLINPYLTNEKIFGIEAGYGFRSSFFNANINLYRTSWADRFQRRSETVNGVRGYSNITGITEIHQGIEVDMNAKINDIVALTGMFSLGDWKYDGNAQGNLFNDNNEPMDSNGNTVASAATSTLYLDKVKVGNYAQTTAALGVDLTPFKNFKFNAQYRYNANLYANLNVLNFATPEAGAAGALKLPSFGLVDLGASYVIPAGGKRYFTIRGNVYNLFDTYYIQESYTNIHQGTTNATGTLYDGIDVANEVFFGFGTTWSASVSFNF
ncbi:TonB-dependent receptor [Chryseobacterium sp. RLHN22]|uniref:TonB-dependent receptor n=1 Tax=Chryseobacterium sp. RLHN22 TaxID=3437885 RepID=UPI003D9B97F2